MEVLIEIRNLNKEFTLAKTTVRALRDVTLDIFRGEYLSIMGPSGSGKSTLLHLLGGLDRPTGGEVILQGETISTLSDTEATRLRRDRTGFVFQFFNLIPLLDVRENIALPFTIAGQDPGRGEVAAQIRDVIALVELTGKERAKPDQRVEAGDRIRLPPVRRSDPEAAGASPPPSPSLQKLVTDAIVYEDRDLLVLNKPAGVAVHGGSGMSHGVIEVLRAARPDDKELELVHRLDRDTRHARELAAGAQRQGPGPVHWVAHSYGGIVALHCLALGESLPPGRIVLIGSPVRGSAPARCLADWPVTRRWFGVTLEQGLLGGAPGLTGDREVAVIAGDHALGLGGLFAGFDEPHDGTVAVAETVLESAADRIVLPHSHFGLVFAAEVAEAVARFLRTGRLTAGESA